MFWTIEKLYSPPVLRAVAAGLWNLNNFTEMVNELCREKLKYPFCSILIDDRALQWEGVIMSEMNAVVNLFKSNDYAFANTRIALLMESIDDFFVAYQFQKMTEPSSSAILKIFHEESTAIDWLTVVQK